MKNSFSNNKYSITISNRISDLLSLNNQGKGSLKVEEVGPAITIKLNALSHFTLEELHSIYNDSLFFSTETAINLLPKVHERVLLLEQVGHMKQLYSLLYPKHSISHFSHFYEHSTSASLLGETYNSSNSRNSVYISLWPKTSHINNIKSS